MYVGVLLAPVWSQVSLMSAPAKQLIACCTACKASSTASVSATRQHVVPVVLCRPIPATTAPLTWLWMPLLVRRYSSSLTKKNMHCQEPSRSQRREAHVRHPEHFRHPENADCATGHTVWYLVTFRTHVTWLMFLQPLDDCFINFGCGLRTMIAEEVLSLLCVLKAIGLSGATLECTHVEAATRSVVYRSHARDCRLQRHHHTLIRWVLPPPARVRLMLMGVWPVHLPLRVLTPAVT